MLVRQDLSRHLVLGVGLEPAIPLVGVNLRTLADDWAQLLVQWVVVLLRLHLVPEVGLVLGTGSLYLQDGVIVHQHHSTAVLLVLGAHERWQIGGVLLLADAHLARLVEEIEILLLGAELRI